MTDVIDVEGKVAMVTGCSSGMGRADAIALAEHGAVVALCARRTGRLEALAQEIEGKGGRALSVPLDVSDVAAVRSAVDSIGEKLGPIDILVNNAAVTRQAPVLDAEPEYFDWIYGTNIRGSFFVAQAVAPADDQKRQGWQHRQRELDDRAAADSSPSQCIPRPRPRSFMPARSWPSNGRRMAST